MELPDAPASADQIRDAVEHALASEGVSMNLSLAVVDDATIHRLNREFLDHDYPTDVIAFDLTDDHDPLQGEIVVSAETALREAKRRGIDPTGELLLYCIHGVLHLIGYDDHDPANRARMHARQAGILNRLGFETTE